MSSSKATPTYAPMPVQFTETEEQKNASVFVRARLSGAVSRDYHAQVVERLQQRNEAMRGCLEDAVRENVKRCWECDAFAAWHEVGWGGEDKFWCEEHVCIPQRAISKGAGRYQPQRLKYPAWLETARRLVEPSALAAPTGDRT